MCERFVLPEPMDIEREFPVAHPWWRFAPSFNVAPGRPIPVVRLFDGATEGVMLPWGLIPEWAEGDPSKACAPQIAADSVVDDAISCEAWAKGQRCIVPALGFYVWQLTPQRYRQPYFARLVDRTVFGIAALWDRTVHEDEDDVIESCALLTVPSTSWLGDALQLPAILHREDWECWLTASDQEAHSLLRASAQESMVVQPISPRINALEYDDAQLIQPIESCLRRIA